MYKLNRCSLLNLYLLNRDSITFSSVRVECVCAVSSKDGNNTNFVELLAIDSLVVHAGGCA